MFKKKLTFSADEDMVNLGVWLQIYHPNFFDTTMYGHLRYAMWLIFTFINMGIQVIFVVKFRLQVLTDTVEPMRQSDLIMKQGRAKTYDDWIQGVFKLSKDGVKDLTVTPNILDVGVGHNIAAKDLDPFLEFLPAFTAILLAIQITFAMREKMRHIMLLCDFGFYDIKSISRKVKILILCFFLSVRIMLMAIILEAAIIFILLASNTIELLNNVLSVLVLD